LAEQALDELADAVSHIGTVGSKRVVAHQLLWWRLIHYSHMSDVRCRVFLEGNGHRSVDSGFADVYRAPNGLPYGFFQRSRGYG
jgi:hypothetical protein